MTRAALIAPLGFVLGVVALSFNVGNEIHVPVGGGRGPLMMSGLGPSETATSLSDAEARGGRRSFYFRQIGSLTSEVSIPLRPRGPFSVALRVDSTVRTRIDVLEDNNVLAREFVSVGPWREYQIAPILRRDFLVFDLHFQDAPLVGRSDSDTFRRYVDEFVFRGEDGFDLAWGSRLAGGLLLLFLTLVAQSVSRTGAAVLALVVGPSLLGHLASSDPAALSLALPRLFGFVLFAAALTLVLSRILCIGRSIGAALTLMGSGMILAYGGLSFLPNHSPADLDIHIWRAVDFADVPMTYDAWLRYGSHYPTQSQARGSATEALGDGPAIPYSPLPYVLFYAAHAAGLDLHWSMNAIEVTTLALLLPLIFAVGRAASSPGGGLLAAALMATDLATIHRLGRAHAPAVVGGALGLGALLAFGLALPRMHGSKGWRVPALLLGLGALGYSSTPVFYALFGIALIALVMVSADTRRLVGPITMALVGGGLTALVLFYGHYLPGLIRGGGGLALMSDPFPGRTFFIFHNESRQSLRLWRLGLFLPFLAAIPATYIVVTRCSALVRPFLLAWIGAWAGIMLMKEPWAFPRLLRWAKEDFYVAPALALLIAIGIARVESRPLRIGLAVAWLVATIALRGRDYGFHVDTLRFMR